MWGSKLSSSHTHEKHGKFTASACSGIRPEPNECGDRRNSHYRTTGLILGNLDVMEPSGAIVLSSFRDLHSSCSTHHRSPLQSDITNLTARSREREQAPCPFAKILQIIWSISLERPLLDRMRNNHMLMKALVTVNVPFTVCSYILNIRIQYSWKNDEWKWMFGFHQVLYLGNDLAS